MSGEEKINRDNIYTKIVDSKVTLHVINFFWLKLSGSLAVNVFGGN